MSPQKKTAVQIGSAESEPVATLSARGLTKVYATGSVDVYALRGVDLELYQSELVVLLGALWQR